MEGDLELNTKFHSENIPAYIGVYNSLYKDIIDGIYPSDTILPGETALSRKYGVSRNTLRQALAILHEDGMIIKSQGKGTLVAPRVMPSSKGQFTHPLLSMSKLPVTDTAITYNYGAPTDIAKDRLRLEASDLVLACNCVFQSDKTILGYSFTQISALFFKELKLDTSDTESIKELILKSLFLYSKKIDMNIKLIHANNIEIEFLKVPPETPLLLIEALHIDRTELPFARNKFYFIPEYYHINFVISSQGGLQK